MFHLLFPSPGTILSETWTSRYSSSLNRKTHHGPFPLSKAGVLYFSVNVTLSVEHSQNLTWATISVMFNIHPEQSCHIFSMCVVGGLMKLWHSLRDGSCSGLLIHFALRAYDAFAFFFRFTSAFIILPPDYPRSVIIRRAHIMVPTRKPIVVHPSPLTAEILCFSQLDSCYNWTLPRSDLPSDWPSLYNICSMQPYRSFSVCTVGGLIFV